MPTELATLLGKELTVGINPPSPQRTFTGPAGLNGLYSMNMGHRGITAPILGTLRAYGGSYEIAREQMDAFIIFVSSLDQRPPASYSHQGSVYYNAIFNNFRVLSPQYRYTMEGFMVVKFRIDLVSLA
ncbi:MAG: hypothetical protein OEV87_11620 [Phycisphaerae bacterium]|nr:hypothetical protein [Phycisphaerae bacterium]